MYYIGPIGVKYTILCKKLPCKYIYKYGYPQLHIYIGYGMLVPFQIVIFSCIISVYTVCHIDHYVKVHQVQIKFWLIMANSASGHSFRHLPSILVMTYSLTV